MSEPKVRFPVICPTCHQEQLVEFPVDLVASGLITENRIRLFAPCHEVAWDASPVELEQIREYLGSAWLDCQRA
jgi:hypothetical protein